jgi:hypothetical protein
MIEDSCELAPELGWSPTEIDSLDDVGFATAMLVTKPSVLSIGTRMPLAPAADGAVPS